MPVFPGQAVVRCSVALRNGAAGVASTAGTGRRSARQAAPDLPSSNGLGGRHLHAFRVDGAIYGSQFDDYPAEELDEKSVTVITAIGRVDHFVYEYDFGDSWEHAVTVEAVWRMPIGLKLAVCLDGANACPPEDCGGPPGYEELLRVLADPSHEDHDHIRGWIGGAFDPTESDLALPNARPQALR